MTLRAATSRREARVHSLSIERLTPSGTRPIIAIYFRHEVRLE